MTSIPAPEPRDARHPALRRAAEERAADVQNRAADAITAFAGSMWFVYIHIVLFAWWLVTNGFPFDDPFPYGLLTMAVSLEAIFLSTFVLISQNRADVRRALMAEHEWSVVQVEERQNEELLIISRQVLALTTELRDLTAQLHAAQPGQPRT